jgi:hypothetical protein
VGKGLSIRLISIILIIQVEPPVKVFLEVLLKLLLEIGDVEVVFLAGMVRLVLRGLWVLLLDLLAYRGERLNVYQLNIYDFLALFIFAVVGHDTETEADNEFISCFLQELTRETCFFHVIIMKEKVLRDLIRCFRVRIL